VNETVDWDRRAADQRAVDLAWSRSVDEARRILGPLLNPALRQASEARRAGSTAAVELATP
nr:hypothetical protein [Acidimicrobiia bacterium]